MTTLLEIIGELHSFFPAFIDDYITGIYWWVYSNFPCFYHKIHFRNFFQWFSHFLCFHRWLHFRNLLASYRVIFHAFVADYITGICRMEAKEDFCPTYFLPVYFWLMSMILPVPLCLWPCMCILMGICQNCLSSLQEMNLHHLYAHALGGIVMIRYIYDYDS